MSYAAQLVWAMRESYNWSWPHRWGRSNGTPYSRQPKSREVTPRKLCKQEAPTLTVWAWRSCVPKGFTNEGCKEVYSEREAITSLHWTIPNPWEVWNRGVQAGFTTVVGKSPWHLPCIIAKEVLECICECCIIRSGTARGRFNIYRAPDQDLGSKESCHKAQDDQDLQDTMEQP
jgi:hypothetical protein